MAGSIANNWDQSYWEVYARRMEQHYGSDFQQEPPLVADKQPATWVFGWHIPKPKQPAGNKIINALWRVCFFAESTIMDLVEPLQQP